MSETFVNPVVPVESAGDGPVGDRRAFLAALAMAAAAGAAVALKPRTVWALTGLPSLDKMVPSSFAGWEAQPTQSNMVVDPSLQEELDTLYADQLSRVYRLASGGLIMMSLAYGRNQNRDLQVHKPEVCYVAQGFQLLSSQRVAVRTTLADVPSLRLVTKLGPRVEPVTYWIRVGDRVIRGWFEQNKARVSMGLQGKVPDGLLVRVSSIDDDLPRAFALQDRFLSDMLGALRPAYRPMFIGTLST